MTDAFDKWHKHVTDAPLSDVMGPEQLSIFLRMLASEPDELVKLVKQFADWLEGAKKE